MRKYSKLLKRLATGLIGWVTAFNTLLFAVPLDQQLANAALTINIMRYSAWPSAVANSKTLTLCVYGDNVVQEAFASAQSKNIDGKAINVTTLTRLRNLDACHVIYFSQLPPNLTQQVSQELQQKPVLTVGDSATFAQDGGMVGIDSSEGKLNMSANIAVINSSGIKVSARLLNLAKIINP